ncbi:hypothetical protein CE195_13370 [Sodalis-like symbiont of Philaenus spumarius]|nr:hypothetical protein CE195_13370 [Sodalis-like symbiont of Philaenus spumarius]
MQRSTRNVKMIQILKTGHFVDANSSCVSFSEHDLALMEVTYNHHSKRLGTAPLCLGHPPDNAPAYGEVQSLLAKNEKLYALVNPSPSLVDMVKAGRYKKVSASFMRPLQRNNPVPQSYYLAHVGFLGANPPAIKGMEQFYFSEPEILPTLFKGNEEYVYFSESNTIAKREDADRHRLVSLISNTLNVSYTEAANLSKTYWNN